MATGQLFDKTLAPRKPRIVRMHIVDAGINCDGDGGPNIGIFECNRCGHNTGWVKFKSVAEAKRGMPCPKCNGAQGV